MKTKEQIEELANIIYPTNTYVSAARNEGFIKAYIVCQDHLKQELEEKTKQEAVKFGRWLLKYSEQCYDEKGLLCWSHSSKLYDTEELYEQFKKEQDGSDLL